MKKLFAYGLILAVLTACTPLTDVAQRGDIEGVRAFLDKGADVNEKNLVGITALHQAAMYGHTDVVRLLIERGADVNAKNLDGFTPLHWAAEKGHTDVVRLLLDKGAVQTTARWPLHAMTPLLLAQKNGHTMVVRILQLAIKSDRPDVDTLPAFRATKKPNSYAIVIGIEQYRQKLPKADFATHDAHTMTEYLTKVMGYPEENVVTLLNDKALKSDMEKYFEKWLLNNVEKDGTVFIYYSGHGAPNPKTGDAYLVPYDGDPAFIDETGYSLKRLYEKLGKLQAKEIVVALDSCFSGADGRSVIAKGARPLVMTMESLQIPKKVAVLSAASGEQISSTYEEKGHGLFTYFMLKGLKGEGDANKDGSVDLHELFEYLKPQVEHIARKIYNNEQLPQLIAPEERHKTILLEGAK